MARKQIVLLAGKVGSLVPDSDCDTLRWSIPPAVSGGGACRMSTSPTVNATSGVHVEPGSGETLLGTQVQAVRPLYFYAIADTIITWDDSK